MTIRHLDDLSAQVLPASDESTASESLKSFWDSSVDWKAIADLLEPRERSRGSTAAAETTETEDDVEPRPFIDPASFPIQRQARRRDHLGPAGRTDHATRRSADDSLEHRGRGPAKQYGAVVRKTILRLAGCIVGGLATLAAMLIVSQNFDSLAAYLVGDICRDDVLDLRGSEQ